jgi:hypothetical protein
MVSMAEEITDPKEPLKVVVSYCSRCGGYKNHKITASEVEADTDSAVFFSTTFDLLRCQGCGAISVRRDDFCDDPATVYPGEGWGVQLDDSNGRHDYDFWPSVVKRPIPDWLYEIRETVLKDTLIETYGALNANLPILAAQEPESFSIFWPISFSGKMRAHSSRSSTGSITTATSAKIRRRRYTP